MNEDDEELGTALHAQMFELWVEPELTRRGDLVRTDVRRALVLMESTGPVVRLNEEFDVVAQARSTRAIAAGEEVTRADFDEIRWAEPLGVDPNVGWILYMVVGSDAYITFDFRQNLARATEMLQRAQEFLELAEDGLEKKRLGPAIDNALSAAELTIRAQVHLIDTPTKESHRQRLNFWAEWVRLGNAPAHLADTFARLTDERGRARYADAPLTIDARELQQLLDEVRDMIEVASGAAARRTERSAPPSQD